MRLASFHKYPSINQLALFSLDDQVRAPPEKRRTLIRETPLFDPRLLQLPLFSMESSEDDEPETVLVDTFEIQTVALHPEPDDEEEPPLAWSGDGVAQLHSILLHESLAVLAGRGNGLQKREVLEWIFEPDYFGEVMRNGISVPIFNWNVPWSFLFCCRLERMHDPDIIRDFIKRLLPEGAAIFT